MHNWVKYISNRQLQPKFGGTKKDKNTRQWFAYRVPKACFCLAVSAACYISGSQAARAEQQSIRLNRIQCLNNRVYHHTRAEGRWGGGKAPINTHAEWCLLPTHTIKQRREQQSYRSILKKKKAWKNCRIIVLTLETTSASNNLPNERVISSHLFFS